MDGLLRHAQEEVPDDLETRKERERIRQFAYHHLTDTPKAIVSSEAIKAICDRHQVCQQCDDSNSLYQPVTLVKSLTVGVDVLPQAFQQEDTYLSGEISHLSEQDLRKRHLSKNRNSYHIYTGDNGPFHKVCCGCTNKKSKSPDCSQESVG